MCRLRHYNQIINNVYLPSVVSLQNGWSNSVKVKLFFLQVCSIKGLQKDATTGEKEF